MSLRALFFAPPSEADRGAEDEAVGRFPVAVLFLADILEREGRVGQRDALRSARGYLRSFTENVVSCVEVSDCLPGLKHSLATRRRAPRCRKRPGPCRSA